ncbi:GntR family transcriptional regulator [Synergistaceae bacterium OttesenSCG-928-I11]|nr:GntR family transcriptional regulator [Synergistaceae bacterium OttesenSCG-928-I11]
MTVDTVYESLKRMILFKELVSGQKLSEIGLSEQLGVSRTPVREALRRLSNEGFVLIVPKSGAWVASPTRREVEDAYAVRARLESWAASMAVHNVTPLFLARLEEKIGEEDKIFKDRDLEGYLEVNRGFHMIIAEASKNSVLMEYISDILSKTFIYMVFMERYFDFEHNPSLDEHREILAAFAARDEARCVELSERHVRSAITELRLT